MATKRGWVGELVALGPCQYGLYNAVGTLTPGASTSCIHGWPCVFTSKAAPKRIRRLEPVPFVSPQSWTRSLTTRYRTAGQPKRPAKAPALPESLPTRPVPAHNQNRHRRHDGRPSASSKQPASLHHTCRQNPLRYAGCMRDECFEAHEASSKHRDRELASTQAVPTSTGQANGSICETSHRHAAKPSGHPAGIQTSMSQAGRQPA